MKTKITTLIIALCAIFSLPSFGQEVEVREKIKKDQIYYNKLYYKKFNYTDYTIEGQEYKTMTIAYVRGYGHIIRRLSARDGVEMPDILLKVDLIKSNDTIASNKTIAFIVKRDTPYGVEHDTVYYDIVKFYMEAQNIVFTNRIPDPYDKFIVIEGDGDRIYEMLMRIHEYYMNNIGNIEHAERKNKFEQIFEDDNLDMRRDPDGIFIRRDNKYCKMDNDPYNDNVKYFIWHFLDFYKEYNLELPKTYRELTYSQLSDDNSVGYRRFN